MDGNPGCVVCVVCVCALKGSTSPKTGEGWAGGRRQSDCSFTNKNVVPDVIVHFFMIPFTNVKSSDSDTHEWINEICFCCSFPRMPRHLIVTCMNLSMASMLDKNSCFGLGDPRIGVVVVGSSNSLCILQLAFNTCDLEPWPPLTFSSPFSWPSSSF